MSITLNCICCLPRDTLVLGTILGYLSLKFDTHFKYIIYSLTWIKVISRRFFRTAFWMIGLLPRYARVTSDQSRFVVAFLTTGSPFPEAIWIAIQ